MNAELQPLTDPSRWALVTGASAGIGAEFCRQLAAMDYHLVLVARRADRLHALANELKAAHGTACLVLPADLSQVGAARDIAKRLVKEDIFVEFLVNNAGYGVPGEYHDVAWPTHADFIQVMVTSVCDLTHRLLPAMRDRGRGHVLNVASVAGLIPASRGHTLYGASKSFMVRFSEALHLENADAGVKVCALCPGFTYSEFHDVTGTRDLVSQLPGFMWQQAPDVVRLGIDSVTRRRPRVVAVPGLFYRVFVWVNSAIPRLGFAMSRRMSKRFRKLD